MKTESHVKLQNVVELLIRAKCFLHRANFVEVFVLIGSRLTIELFFDKRYVKRP